MVRPRSSLGSIWGPLGVIPGVSLSDIDAFRGDIGEGLLGRPWVGSRVAAVELPEATLRGHAVDLVTSCLKTVHHQLDRKAFFSACELPSTICMSGNVRDRLSADRL